MKGTDDARIGRWLAVDPLATKYPSMSAFAFVLDNPIRNEVVLDRSNIEQYGRDGEDSVVIVVAHEAGHVLDYLDDFVAASRRQEEESERIAKELEERIRKARKMNVKDDATMQRFKIKRDAQKADRVKDNKKREGVE